MEVDGIQASSVTTVDREVDSPTSTIGAPDGTYLSLSLKDEAGAISLNMFMRSAEARDRLKQQSHDRQQAKAVLVKRRTKYKSRINTAESELRAQRSLGNWDEEGITKLEGDVHRLEDLVVGINAQLDKVQKEIDALEEYVQPRNPGKCRRDEATSLETHIDTEYVTALTTALDSCKEVSLEEALEKLQPYLQRFMLTSQYKMTKSYGSQDQEQFKATLEEYVEYIKTDRAEGDKPFIRAYTGQRFPVYATVSAQMVNTETRFTDSQLSRAILDCLPWQAMLHKELSSLPPLGPATLFRGIGYKFKNLGEIYRVGLERILYEPKSTSVYREAAAEFARPDGTLFIMECTRAVDITSYSEYPYEHEAMLQMFTRFRVTSITRFAESYDEIHMEEIIDEDEGDIVSD